MCKILDKVKGKSAEEILHEFWPEQTMPVNIEMILERIGIVYQADTFASLKENEEIQKLIKEYGDIYGLIVATEENVGIFYKKNILIIDDAKKRRISEYKDIFVLAHELGHCALHAMDVKRQPYIDFNLKNARRFKNIDLENSDMVKYYNREVEANIFAGELLVPEKKINELLSKLDYPFLSIIADAFEVTANVMKARLVYLGLPYIDDMR